MVKLSLLQQTQENLGFFYLFYSTWQSGQCLPEAPGMAVGRAGHLFWAEHGRGAAEHRKELQDKELDIEVKKQDRHLGNNCECCGGP